MRAEEKFANFVVEHNMLLAVSNHLTPLIRDVFSDRQIAIIRDVFSDRQIAKKYASQRTKTISIFNHATAPHFKGKVLR